MQIIQEPLHWVSLLALSVVVFPDEVPADEVVSERVVPWTTSRVKGSPDPPLPFKTTRVFADVELDKPTDISWVVSAGKWLATQAGAKPVTFGNDPAKAQAEPWLDLSEALGRKVFNCHSVLFHQDLENQPWCFFTFIDTLKDPNGVKLGRMKVTDPTGPTVDPSSVEVLLSWSSGGHIGCAMQFGPDGMLYLSIGDGQRPYPPDANNTGQDISDLQASILRIDVSNPTDAEPYRIPTDNPFVNLPDTRPEIWAYGFRNPWKIAFDPNSGDLLAADVGWEMREIIHRVERGRNHGWSIMEGSQTVKDEQSKIPITPPLFEHTHIDSRSISGGHYWQSDRIPELKGAYIYGDWMTGKVWALKHKGDELLWQKELVDTPFQVISFMLDPTGEVFIVSYDGTILRLDPNDEATRPEDFPQKLSQTGIFTDVVAQQPANGVVEYEISAHHWADGTTSRQWIAIPESEQLGMYEKDDWTTGDVGGRFRFPADTVVAKTVSYRTDADDASTERRLETQLLHRYLDDWRAYNYVWNEDQTDAVLQDDIATERKLSIKDLAAPGGLRQQTWRHSSRSECLLCHIWATGSVHAFWPEQLNIDVDGKNQLEQLASLGLFERKVSAKSAPPSPYDESQPLEERARSYLALNCSTCHRKQGGGTADFNFDLTKSLKENNYLDALPAQGDFDIDNARVVAPGDPLRSVMLYRTLKSGRGHMPQFGSNVVDRAGIQVLHDWIASIEPSKTQQSDLDQKISELSDGPDFDQAIQELLKTTSGAMALSLACGNDSLSDATRNRVVKLGTAHNDPIIRDLFEHHIPEEHRIKRLGPTIDADALLAMKGSTAKGRLLFEYAKDVNCRTCHRIGTIGKSIGPDLSGIGARQKPREILTSILEPSKKIDAKFRARTIVTAAGKIYSGIVNAESKTEITLVDSTGKATTLPTDAIEESMPSAKSAMPDQLLSGMTAQQAADLLAFLCAQQAEKPVAAPHEKHLSFGEQPVFRVRKTSEPITVDGRMDERAWQQTETRTFDSFYRIDQPDDRQKTTFRMMWDDENLYVFFEMEDAFLTARETERDGQPYFDDCAEIFLMTAPAALTTHVGYELNLNKASNDFLYIEGFYSERNAVMKSFNPDFQVEVSYDGTVNDNSDRDIGWTMEFAIPMSNFNGLTKFVPAKAGNRWGFQAVRQDRNDLEGKRRSTSTIFPVYDISKNVHQKDRFGLMEFVE